MSSGKWRLFSLGLNVLIDQVIIGSDDGVLPVWHQAIIWTNAELLLIEHLRTNSNNSNKIKIK